VGVSLLPVARSPRVRDGAPDQLIAMARHHNETRIPQLAKVARVEPGGRAAHSSNGPAMKRVCRRCREPAAMLVAGGDRGQAILVTSDQVGVHASPAPAARSRLDCRRAGATARTTRLGSPRPFVTVAACWQARSGPLY
jgi:hypothetical protein